LKLLALNSEVSEKQFYFTCVLIGRCTTSNEVLIPLEAGQALKTAFGGYK
jgi:hypothetical protein